jgi:hypothetical protein
MVEVSGSYDDFVSRARLRAVLRGDAIIVVPAWWKAEAANPLSQQR